MMLALYRHGAATAVGGVPGAGSRCTRRLARSGAGRHVSGQDVVGVAVEILAGAVVTHRGAWVGVAGGDLDIAQIHPGIEHGGDERVAEHADEAW
jgi:hypothetical protein